MKQKNEFQQQQFEFAAHLRDPKQHPRPLDVEDRRMGIYRELFYNNVNNFLTSSFPVINKIFPEKKWHLMVRDFFHQHISHSPYFLDIPQEFLNYLEQERHEPDDPVFLFELAHYEWVELALDIAEEEMLTDNINPEGDLLSGVPVLSPIAWSLHYQYPVHQISPDFIPCEADKQDTFLIVYRNRDDQVGFMEINAVTARLVYLMDTTDVSGAQLLQQLAIEMKVADAEKVIKSGQKTLEQLHSLDIIIGTAL